MGEMSVATTWVPGRSLAMAQLTQPVPQPISSTRTGLSARAASMPSRAASTRSSVSGRGMSTPGAQATSTKRKLVLPVMY